MLFDKLLVANRGEIAVRLMKTARRLGIRTVGIYSEADRESLHVSEADEAHCIGGPSAADSYLNAAKILAVAKETGATVRAARSCWHWWRQEQPEQPRQPEPPARASLAPPLN